MLHPNNYAPPAQRVLLIILLLFFISLCSCHPNPTAAISRSLSLQTSDSAPDFEEPIGNHTVALGKDVQLACKINNLGPYRTAWLRVEDKGILTIHNNIITRNYRFGLINNDEGRNFILTIKNVQPQDRGGYMCQINSVPMRSSVGYLDVLTPPIFEDTAPSTSTYSPGSLEQPQPSGALVTVTEGSNATLSCRASGHPLPAITWRREDQQPILLEGTQNEVLKVEDTNQLMLNSVHRLNAGAYLCIAANGVQPAASKRQVLDVQFAPTITLPQTAVGVALGTKAAPLICVCELNPLGSYHWFKLAEGTISAQQVHSSQADDLALLDSGEELSQSDKFDIVIKQLNSEKVQMTLIIKRIERTDLTHYKCIARNSLGLQSNTVRLFESADGLVLSGTNEQHQNDQQEPTTNNNNNNRLAGQRTHTRSSWTTRGGRYQQHNNERASAQSSAASMSLPTIGSMRVRKSTSTGLLSSLLIDMAMIFMSSASSFSLLLLLVMSSTYASSTQVTFAST